MRRVEFQWWNLCCLTLAAIVTFGIGGCKKTSVVGSPVGIGLLPECPKGGDWSGVFTAQRLDIGNPATGELAIAGRRTNVPEFNDCQRFINYTGTGEQPEYLPLFAIFSRDTLGILAARFDSVPDTLVTHADSAAVGPGGAGRPLAVGVIYAMDNGYPHLGIEHDFNCLFLYGKIGTANGLEAKVIPVGVHETQCGSISDPTTMPGTVLEVRRKRFETSDVPDVARWDWDSTAQRQHMGIGCGSAWCDIGAPSFHPARPHMSSVTSATTRMLAVKGWYDEQQLAVPPTVTTPLSVGLFSGTLVPMPDLGAFSGPTGLIHFTTWQPVAVAAMQSGSSVYFDKLNLATSTIPHMIDTVYLCQGRWTDCAGSSAHHPKCETNTGWWAKIVSNPLPAMVGGLLQSTHYFCVTRRGHESIPNFHIPGVVRWRWALNDETMWVRCLEGCCEVEAGSKDS